MRNTILVLFFLGFIFACKNQKKEVVDSAAKENPKTNSAYEKDDVRSLDTTIILSGINSSKYKGPNLSEKLAIKTLFSHFEKKGLYTDGNLPDNIEGTDETVVVSYDTILVLNLNGNKYDDAIISFWLVPHGANGSGFKPHYAILSDIDGGYKISNEEFIPEMFSIDSVVLNGSQNLLYGKDHSYGNRENARRFTIKLK